MSRPVSVPACVFALGALALGGIVSHAVAQTAAPAYPPIAPATVVSMGEDSIFSVELAPLSPFPSAQ